MCLSSTVISNVIPVVSAQFPLPYQLSPSGDNHVSHIRPDNLSVAERYYHSASVDNLRQGNATLVAGTRGSLSERQYYSCTLAGIVCT